MPSSLVVAHAAQIAPPGRGSARRRDPGSGRRGQRACARAAGRCGRRRRCPSATRSCHRSRRLSSPARRGSCPRAGRLPSAVAASCSSSTPRSDGIESKPQLCTIRAPLVRRERVEAVDRVAHEQHLAGEVGVVRARARARLDAPASRNGGRGRPCVATTRVSPRARSTAAGRSRRRGAAASRLRVRRARSADRAGASCERPASPIRACGGAARARYSAHSRPTKLVAPKRTRSSSRSVLTRGYYVAGVDGSCRAALTGQVLRSSVLRISAVSR